jgi:hypothetical protein
VKGLIIKAQIRVRDGKLYIESSFVVPLSDHNIAILSIVKQKIATEIMVNFKATLALRS